MIISKLKGGLGNQMFQYAFGRRLAIKNNCELKIDLNYLNDRTPKKFFVFREYELDIFKLKVQFAESADLLHFKTMEYGLIQSRKKIAEQNKINRYAQDRYYTFIEPYFHFFSPALEYPDNSYLNGYWQSEKYFEDIEEILRQDFTFIQKLSGDIKTYADEIINSNSVCLHVRYGYLTNLRDKLVHGFVGMDYINRAINLIKEKVTNPVIFIFSDNPAWCRDNIQSDLTLRFPELELPGEKNTDYFQLMTLCKHFIISNSSFSWWGAWLSDNKDKIVIAPKKWFRFSLNNTKDLCPEDWIRI